MPKKPHAKSRTAMKSKERREALHQEEVNLRTKLQERDLYNPNMRIREMRELCSAIEQSIQSHELYQSSVLCSGLFPAKTPERMDFLLPDAIRQSDFQEKSCVHPLSAIDSNDFLAENHSNAEVSSPSKSPPALECAPLETFEIQLQRSPRLNRRCLYNPPNIGGGYSLEFPGPCCREIHTFQAEIHPEPRTEDATDDSKVMQERLKGIKKQCVVEWEKVDKFV